MIISSSADKCSQRKFLDLFSQGQEFWYGDKNKYYLFPEYYFWRFEFSDNRRLVIVEESLAEIYLKECLNQKDKLKVKLYRGLDVKASLKTRRDEFVLYKRNIREDKYFWIISKKPTPFPVVTFDLVYKK